MKVANCVHDGDVVYTLKSVTPKNGELRGIHMDMKIGGVWLLDWEHSGSLQECLYEAVYDPGYLRPVHLSAIESVVEDDDTMTVTTMNTVYVFEKEVISSDLS